MKRIAVVICAIVIAGLGVSIASAESAGGGFTWTQAKAARVVVTTASVHLERFESSPLEQELLSSARLYSGLQLGAYEAGDLRTSRIYHRLAVRYSSALRKVQRGLEIDRALCRGSGAAKNGRFNRFVCSVSSEVLAIPSAELLPSEGGGLPAVVEGETRILGPIEGRLDVRVTGRSSIAYRQMQ